MHDLHRSLFEQVPQYASWHQYRHHKAVHWAVLFAVAVFLTGNFVLDARSTELAAAVENSSLSGDHFKHLSVVKSSVQEPVQDHILLKFKNGVTVSERSDLYWRYSLKEQKVIAPTGVRIVAISSSYTPEEIVQRLKGDSKNTIDFAEVDGKISPALEPSDPYYGSEWHLPKVEAAKAWDTTQGSGVTIAVIDTGIDSTHPDLTENVLSGWNFFDNNNVTADLSEHGTLVAGVIAASANNGAGIAGVAWKSKILPLRVTDGDGYAYISHIIEALVYAADHGAKVANISFDVSKSPSVQAAAQYFESKGGVVVVAAGNGGVSSTDANSPDLLTVSATDSYDSITSWSNTGNNIDLSAPGIAILTTGKEGSYVFGNGTSLAAGIVSGTAALVISADPTLNSAQVQNILKQSVEDQGAPGWDTEYGFGIVNVSKAVTLACSYPGARCLQSAADIEAPSAPSNFALSAPDSTAVNLSWSPASDNVGVTGYSVYRGDVNIKDVKGTSYKDTSVVAGYTYLYYVKAFDAAGNLSGLSDSISVTVPNTQASTDEEKPSIPNNLDGSAADSTKVNLTWSASTDNVGVAGYKIYRNNNLIGQAAGTEYIDTSVLGGSSYVYTVRAFDASANISQPSTGASVAVPVPTDSKAPSIPTNLKATTRDGKITLSWFASTDNVKVAGYSIFRNGALLATTTLLSYTDVNVNGGTPYTYYVTAYDKVGNTSQASNTVYATVPEVTASPIAITSFMVSKKNATSAIVTWTTAEVSTGGVSFGESGVLSSAMSDPVASKIHSLALTNLTAGTKYYYQISVTDSNGNINKSELSTFRTLAK